MAKRKAVPVSQFWRPPPETTASLKHGQRVVKTWTGDKAKSYDLDRQRRKRK